MSVVADEKWEKKSETRIAEQERIERKSREEKEVARWKHRWAGE